MTAIVYRLRVELRSRRPAWLALAAVVGVVAGAVLAIFGGARRTESAYPRFLEAQRAYDVAVVNYPADGTAVFDLDELARLPQVADAAWGSFEWVGLGPGAGAVASADGRIGTDINRFKLLEGRRADPSRPDEVVVSFDAAERHGLELGSKVSFIPPEFLEPLRHAAAGQLDKCPASCGLTSNSSPPNSCP